MSAKVTTQPKPSGDTLGPETGWLAANFAAAHTDPADIDHVLLAHVYQNLPTMAIHEKGYDGHARVTLSGQESVGQEARRTATTPIRVNNRRHGRNRGDRRPPQRLASHLVESMLGGRHPPALPRPWPCSPRPGPLHVGAGQLHTSRGIVH